MEPINPFAVAMFCGTLVTVLEEEGGSITSWKRSVIHNKAVGGVNDSLHLEGLGADCVFDTAAGRARAKDKLKAKGYGVLDEGDHVHVQARPLKGAAVPVTAPATPA